jgi:hypothetical protein
VDNALSLLRWDCCFTLTIFIRIILIRGEIVCIRTHCNYCTIPCVILYKFVTMTLLRSKISTYGDIWMHLYLDGSDVQNTIKIEGYRTEDAAFRSKRSCVCPNPGFKAQLRLWEAMKFKLESSFLRQIFFKSCLRCISFLLSMSLSDLCTEIHCHTLCCCNKPFV